MWGKAKSGSVAVLVVAGMSVGYWLGLNRVGETLLPMATQEGRNSAPGSGANNSSKGRILYYRNPMGQPDTSPVPKKDQMGMDYIPVYADEAADARMVMVTPGRQQILGVRTAVAETRTTLGHGIRAKTARAVVVPASAVIDSGTRQVVLVERDKGRFVPREVRVGARSREYVELLDGVTLGEKVVVDGNFLIDSESNLRTALAALTSGETASVVQEGQQPEKIFLAVGFVTAIESNGSLTINHEPIFGLMRAMEMMFSVNPGTLTAGVRAGDKIEFSVEGKTHIIRALKVVGHTQ